MVLVGFKPDLWWPTGFLQCFDTVGLVIWPVKIVPEMTYNVLTATLNLHNTTTTTRKGLGVRPLAVYSGPLYCDTTVYRNWNGCLTLTQNAVKFDVKFQKFYESNRYRYKPFDILCQILYSETSVFAFGYYRYCYKSVVFWLALLHLVRQCRPYIFTTGDRL